MSVCALLLLAIQEQDPAPPWLEEEQKERDRIVVVATRTPRSESDLGSSVSVIDREEIRLLGYNESYDLLRTLPGLEVVRTGPSGMTTSVFLRGAEGDGTLVLIDGIRANSTTLGGFNFTDLQASNIDRIEVLRGPQSTLYGSEAAGGVVNIITRKGEEGLRGSVLVEGGQFQHRRGVLRLSGGVEQGDFSIVASGVETDNLSSADEDAGNTEEDPYKNKTLSARLGLNAGENGRLDLTLRSITGDVGLDGFAGGSPVDDPNFTQERHAIFTSLQWVQDIAGVWKQTIRIGTADDDLDGDDPDTAFNNYTINTRISEALWQSDFELSEAHLLTLGYEVEKREAVNRGAFDEVVYLRSGFVHEQFQPAEDLLFTVGARLDDHEEAGSEATWRVTGSVRTSKATRFHGSVGTAFRAPDFNELFFPFSGNPDLDPERTFGADLGLEQTFFDGRLLGGLTLFYNDFEDLIAFDLGTFTFVNIRDARARGLELEADLRLSKRWALLSSYTLNDTEDRDTGEQLDRRPKHRGTLQVRFAAEGVTAALSVIVVRSRTQSGGTEDMDDYERVDLSVNHIVDEHVRLQVRLMNLLDEDYNEVPEFTTPGFHGFVGTEIRY